MSLNGPVLAHDADRMRQARQQVAFSAREAERCVIR